MFLRQAQRDKDKGVNTKSLETGKCVAANMSVSRPKKADSKTHRLGLGVHCVTPALEKLEQGDSEFKANLNHTVRNDCEPTLVGQRKVW